MKESAADPATADRWLQWYRAARAGSKEAEDRLLTELRPFFGVVVQTHARGQAFGAWDASDVVQECCVKLKLVLPDQDFRGTTGQEFVAWLRTMAYRQFLDTVRDGKALKRGGGQQTGRLPGDSNGDVAVAADTSTPSRQLMRREEEEALEAALGRLPAEYQRVIRLRRSADKLTWAAIARQMDSTEDAAKQLFRRAFKRLSEELRGPP
jgi:RNA polymerase sigma factor (sigma-70 family)